MATAQSRREQDLLHEEVADRERAFRVNQWLQAETASKNVRISKVPGPENVADANTKTADKRLLEFCRLNVGVAEIPKQFRDTVL